jgi:serine/threonine protein kinase
VLHLSGNGHEYPVAARVIAGRFRLERTLSASVMSEVWLAVDPELDRQVVVKLLAQDADRARFEREAQAAAGLTHENIVRLFDYGEEEGRPYMVFEYLPGGSLEDRLAGPALSESEAIRIARDMAEGLAHAHEQGVVHRDLKPANVLFDAEGRAKIADFGIAQLGGATTLTEAGTILGTAAYMSPEQAAGEPATPASDVYSFGVVLYRMLAGGLPFEANNPAELAAMHRTTEPPPLGADISPALAQLTMRTLDKRPERRPASGTALAELLTLDAPPAVAAEAATRVLPAARPRRRGRRVSPAIAAGFSLLLLAVLGAVAAVLLMNHSSSAGQESPVSTAGTTAPTRPTTQRATSSTTSTTESTTTHATTNAPATTTRPTTRATSTTVPVTSPTTSIDTTTIPTTADTTTTAGP